MIAYIELMDPVLMTSPQIRRHFPLPLLCFRRNTSRQRIIVWWRQRRRWIVAGAKCRRPHLHCVGLWVQLGGQRMGVLPRVWRSLQSCCHSWNGFDRCCWVGTRWTGFHLTNPGINGRGRCGASNISWTNERVYHPWRRHLGYPRIM